jgi:hypothetical protein
MGLITCEEMILAPVNMCGPLGQIEVPRHRHHRPVVGVADALWVQPIARERRSESSDGLLDVRPTKYLPTGCLFESGTA